MFVTYSRPSLSRPGPEFGTLPIVESGHAVEYQDMAEAERIHTYDDDLHERRRRLAIVRTPIDFEAERLRRLLEKTRNTLDP